MKYYAMEKVYDLIGERIGEDVQEWDTEDLIAKAGDTLDYSQAYKIVFSGMFEDVQDMIVHDDPADLPWWDGMDEWEIQEELDRQYADYLHDSRIDWEDR